MKRDDDYIRELLLEFAESVDWRVMTFQSLNPTTEEDKRQYHIFLLSDAGLMTNSSKGTFRLTSQGHDYLSSIRDQGIWQKTKEAVADTGGSVTLEIVKSLATGFLKKKIEKHTGIAL